MSFVQVAGLVLGSIFALVGLSAAAKSLRETTPESSGRVRFLLAVHDASKSGFWLALAAVLVGLSLVENPYPYRWLALIPILFASLRLGMAYLLYRS